MIYKYESVSFTMATATHRGLYVSIIQRLHILNETFIHRCLSSVYYNCLKLTVFTHNLLYERVEEKEDTPTRLYLNAATPTYLLI